MQGSDREELQSHIHSYQQSLETARDRGDEHGVEVMSFNLGNIYAALGEQRTASKFYEQNLEIVHKLGDRRSQIAALASLEKIHIDLGEASAATRFHEQNLAIARSLKEAPRDATRLRDHWELGLTLARQGRPEAALVHLEQGLVFLKQIEHPRANEMDVMIKQFRASGKLTDLSADMGLPHGSDIKTGH
jgi:tetratricopeptide (TPR) repeat protein